MDPSRLAASADDSAERKYPRSERTVYCRAGVAAVHIEDEVDPKHSVWDGPLLPTAELQARVEAAVKARRSDDFAIIVRSNEFQVDNGGGAMVVPNTLAAALPGNRTSAEADPSADGASWSGRTPRSRGTSSASTAPC